MRVGNPPPFSLDHCFARSHRRQSRCSSHSFGVLYKFFPLSLAPVTPPSLAHSRSYSLQIAFQALRCLPPRPRPPSSPALVRHQRRVPQRHAEARTQLNQRFHRTSPLVSRLGAFPSVGSCPAPLVLTTTAHFLVWSRFDPLNLSLPDPPFHSP